MSTVIVLFRWATLAQKGWCPQSLSHGPPPRMKGNVACTIYIKRQSLSACLDSITAVVQLCRYRVNLPLDAGSPQFGSVPNGSCGLEPNRAGSGSSSGSAGSGSLGARAQLAPLGPGPMVPWGPGPVGPFGPGPEGPLGPGPSWPLWARAQLAPLGPVSL